MPPPHAAKIVPIDGLRGIAVGLVMMYHLTVIGFESGLTRPLLVLLENGWVGVDLFFVISGFLITGILLDTKGSPNFYRNFWIRRALRILPLYYLFLIAVYCSVGNLDPSRATEVRAISPWWYAGFVSNLLYDFRGAWLWGTLDVSWSLAIEEQFYWLWPVVVALCSPKALVRVCVGLIVVALGLRTVLCVAGLEFIHAHVFTLCRADALAMGGLLAVLWRRSVDRERLIRWGRRVFYVGALAALSVLWFSQVRPETMLVPTIGLTLFSAAFAGLVLLGMTASEGSRLRRVLTTPLLLWFGKYSYCLYLVHVPVRTLIKYKVFNPQATALVWGSRWPSQILFYLVVVGLSMAIAYLSFHLFEKHWLGLKDRLAPSRSINGVEQSKSDRRAA